MVPEIVALHLGALHPYEKVLTLLLAFGPFVVLGIVVAVRRRHDLAEERAETDHGESRRDEVQHGDQRREARHESRRDGEPLSGRATPGRPGSPS